MEPAKSRREPNWTWDEVVLACDIVYQNDWHGMHQKDPRVIELSELLQHFTVHAPESRGPKFRNPDGVGRKTADIATRHPDYKGKPTKGGQHEVPVLQAFMADPARMTATARAIRDGITVKSSSRQYDLDLGGDAADEGRLLERLHLAYERDPKIRGRKIAAVRKAAGTISCEACGFNFAAAYGDHGADYIECHHRVPLHVSGPTRTNLADLVLLCSNCHRMIHHRRPWLTFEQLCVLLAQQSSTAQESTAV